MSGSRLGQGIRMMSLEHLAVQENKEVWEENKQKRWGISETQEPTQSALLLSWNNLTNKIKQYWRTAQSINIYTTSLIQINV